MNRKNIQEKLVKIIGSLETDKSYLLDTFISKLFRSLNLGQKIKINDLGYFHKIRFKFSPQNNYVFSKNDEEVSNIIVFSESENLTELLSEDHIFFEPKKFEFDYSSSDNLFSISAGKEFLTPSIVRNDKIIIPISQNEYFDLLDSKIDNLINISNVSENKESEVPCVNISIKNAKKDLTFQVLKDDTLKDEKAEIIPEINDIVYKESNESNEIDFTGLLDNEISISSPSNEEHTNKSVGVSSNNEIPFMAQNNVIEDDFESLNKQDDDSVFNDLLKLEEIDEQIEKYNISAEEKNLIIESDLDISKNHLTNEIIDDEELEVSGEISWDKIISEINSEEEEISVDSILKSEDEVEEATDNIAEEIKPVETETSLDENIFNDFVKTEEKSSEDVFKDLMQEIEKDEEQEQVNLIDELKDFEGIENIKPSINSYENPSDEKVNFAEDVKEEIYDEKDFESQTNDEIFDEKELETVEEEILAKSLQQESSTSKIIEEDIPKRSNKIWIIAIFSIIILSSAVVYYFFPKYFKFFQTEEQQITLIISDKNTTKIERNFDIPITYPYPPIEEQRINKLFESSIQTETNLLDKSSDIQKIENDIKPNTTSSSIQEKVQTKNTNIERVSDTISKSGDFYIAQVASFRSESIAQREVNKIKSKGYSAFQEKTEIPNKGTWFRVKVSGFKSVDEAQNFQLKYSKGEI